jgi:small redox-active disulfide protein 2
MDIKVLGTGCANCKNTYALIARSAKELGVSIQLTKVEAVESIMLYGVASTPAVVIDGVVVHSGGVPSTSKIRAWLTAAQPLAGCADGEACCSVSSSSGMAGLASGDCSSGSCSTEVGAKNGMGVGALVNLMAGSMILLGFALAHVSGQVDILSLSWLWLPVFVGLNLIQFAFTGFCPAKRMFEKLGVKQSCC